MLPTLEIGENYEIQWCKPKGNDMNTLNFHEAWNKLQSQLKQNYVRLTGNELVEEEEKHDKPMDREQNELVPVQELRSS